MLGGSRLNSQANQQIWRCEPSHGASDFQTPICWRYDWKAGVTLPETNISPDRKGNLQGIPSLTKPSCKVTTRQFWSLFAQWDWYQPWIRKRKSTLSDETQKRSMYENQSQRLHVYGIFTYNAEVHRSRLKYVHPDLAQAKRYVLFFWNIDSILRPSMILEPQPRRRLRTPP